MYIRAQKQNKQRKRDLKNVILNLYFFYGKMHIIQLSISFVAKIAFM